MAKSRVSCAEGHKSCRTYRKLLTNPKTVSIIDNMAFITTITTSIEDVSHFALRQEWYGC